MNRFKELLKNKKVITGIAAAVVVLAVGSTTIYFTTRKPDSQQTVAAAESKNTQPTTQAATKTQEPTTATDIMAVTLKDSDGNDVVLEGVAVTDESGNTKITVKDGSGNEVVVEGKAVTGADGKRKVQDAKVISGGEITTADGSVVDVSGSEVEDITDNNDGSVETDVAVSEETKSDVAQKQEEAKKEESEQQVADNSGNSDNGGNSDNNSSSGSGDSSSSSDSDSNAGNAGNSDSGNAAAPEAPAEPVTEAPTEAPTAPPTEAPTEPQPEHGVAVSTTTIRVVHHDRDNQPAYTEYIEAPVDAYGDITEAVYAEVDWSPEDYEGFTSGYIITAEVFEDWSIYYEKSSPQKTDIRPYIHGDVVNIYLSWFEM